MAKIKLNSQNVTIDLLAKGLLLKRVSKDA
jgi:hypothetical protein